MKNKKTFLAILIIVGFIFVYAAYQNLKKSPPNIEAEKKVEIIEVPECELTLEGCKG